MENKITHEKVKRYLDLTTKALAEVKSKIVSGREEDAKEIIDMVSNYISDAKYFIEKKDLVNAFGALNYAHGWLDSGVRLSVFDVKDDKLFTIK